MSSLRPRDKFHKTSLTFQTQTPKELRLYKKDNCILTKPQKGIDLTFDVLLTKDQVKLTPLKTFLRNVYYDPELVNGLIYQIGNVCKNIFGAQTPEKSDALEGTVFYIWTYFPVPSDTSQPIFQKLVPLDIHFTTHQVSSKCLKDIQKQVQCPFLQIRKPYEPRIFPVPDIHSIRVLLQTSE